MTQAPRYLRVTYIIEAPTCGLIKIGTTDKPEQRFRAHTTTSPAPLVLLGLMPGSLFSENQLHTALAAYRHHGEWFRSEPYVRAYLAQCIKQAADAWFEALDIPALDRIWQLQTLRERWDAVNQGRCYGIGRVSDADLDRFGAEQGIS